MSSELPKNVIDFIKENKNKYEEISIKADPYYEECLRAIDFIKKFIIERGLIIYGGTAIDYALRLHGDKIYPDEELAIPDLDFYSTDSVKDAFDLADILYKEGFKEVRAIRASYVKTMRVDVGHQYLADITHMPPILFEKIPFLTYEGMKIVHPNFQRMDLHIGLTYLFDSPPREAVFLRWKFIKRLNLLDKYYQLPDVPANAAKKTTCAIPYKYTKYVFAGSAAYALLIKWTKLVETELAAKLSDSAKKFCANEWKNIAMLNFYVEESDSATNSPNTANNFSKETGKIIVETFSAIEFINFSIDFMAEEMQLVDIEKFTDVGSFMPKRIHGIDKTYKDNPCSINLYSSAGKYTSIGSIEKKFIHKGGDFSSSSKTRFVGSQYLLSNFIANWIVTGDKSNLILYKSTISLTKIMEKIISDAFKLPEGDVDAAECNNATSKMSKEEIERYITKNPGLISTNAYGDQNMSETLKVSLMQVAMDLKMPDISIPITPINYYPSRNTKRRIPDFNYEDSEFFIKDGRRIDKQ